jgi:hypothetical protein
MLCPCRLTSFDLGTLKHVATETDLTHMLAAPHLMHVTLATMCLTQHMGHVTPCRWRELCLTWHLRPLWVQSWAYLALPPTCKVAVRSTDQVCVAGVARRRLGSVGLGQVRLG